MDNKIKLLQTAKEICERGDVKLSSSDRKRIEDETKDLLKGSMIARQASRTPTGFDKVLVKLKAAKGPDEAFKIVANYMKAVGMIDEEVSEALEVAEEAVETAGEALEEVSEALGEGGDDKPEIGDGEKPDLEDKKPEIDKDGPKDKDEKPEPKADFFEKEPMDGDKLEKEKDEVIKMAQMLDPEMPEAPKKLEKGKDMEKGPGKGPMDLSKLKKEKDKDNKEKMDKDEMGMEKGSPVGSPEIRIGLTKDKNIAVYGKKGPLFIAVPNAGVKKNAEKLRKTANKVWGFVIYEGLKVAAEKCGATLLAGADDYIETDSVAEIPKNTDGATADRETDTKDPQTEEVDTALENNDTDTQDKPDKVVAIEKRLKERRAQRKPARFSVVKNAEDTILDGAMEDTEEKSQDVNPNALSSSGDGDTDTQDDTQDPASDALDDADTDFSGVEANFKKLYAAKAQKQADEAIEKFVKRFTRCMQISAQRMVLNHDDDPLKIAAGDVLTGKDVRFASGEHFVPMDEATAAELIELIASEGHQEFVDHLLSRSADLMEKSDDYLKDVEADLQNLNPVDPVVAEDKEAGCDYPKKKDSSSMRRAASEGNFDLNPSFSGQGQAPSNVLRDAMGITKIGRQTAQLRKLASR
jgi:hypothetical protein